MAEPRAAVDVGTNSVRLLVADGDGRWLTREMTITRLGQGVDATGRLDEAALERTLTVLGRYRDVWRDHGVSDRVRIVATSAVRDAANRDDFFAGVRDRAGVDAEVLSGRDEAAMTFRGASGAVDVAAPVAVLDVGGGSTELIVGQPNHEPVASVSLQLGSVRLTERCLHGDPPSAPEVHAARVVIGERLDEADAALAEQGASLADAASLVGVAGTATTVAALHLGLDAYEPDRIHGARVHADQFEGWALRLTAMTVAERAALGPVQAGREDVIAAGALIIAAVIDRYQFDELVVSESDILDALAASVPDG